MILEDCEITKSQLCSLLNCIQKSVEILKINCDQQEENRVGKSNGLLEFSRLKKLVVRYSGDEEFLVKIFRNCPILESLKVTWNGVEIISGKFNLKKLSLESLHGKYK